jgi:hypothetical protein
MQHSGRKNIAPKYPALKFGIETTRQAVGASRKKSVPNNINNLEHNIFGKDSIYIQSRNQVEIPRTASQSNPTHKVRRNDTSPEHPLKIATALYHTIEAFNPNKTLDFKDITQTARNPLPAQSPPPKTAAPNSQAHAQHAAKKKCNPKKNSSWYDTKNPVVGLDLSSKYKESKRQQDKLGIRENNRQKVAQIITNSYAQISAKKYGTNECPCTQLIRQASH